MLLLAAVASGFSSLPVGSFQQCMGNFPAETITTTDAATGMTPEAACYKQCFEHKESQFTNGQCARPAP